MTDRWDRRARLDAGRQRQRLGLRLVRANRRSQTAVQTLELGRIDEAARDLQGAVELDPAGDTEAWDYLAFAYYRDMKSDEGGEILRQGIEATDSDAIRAPAIRSGPAPSDVTAGRR